MSMQRVPAWVAREFAWPFSPCALEIIRDALAQYDWPPCMYSLDGEVSFTHSEVRKNRSLLLALHVFEELSDPILSAIRKRGDGSFYNFKQVLPILEFLVERLKGLRPNGEISPNKAAWDAVPKMADAIASEIDKANRRYAFSFMQGDSEAHQFYPFNAAQGFLSAVSELGYRGQSGYGARCADAMRELAYAYAWTRVDMPNDELTQDDQVTAAYQSYTKHLVRALDSFCEQLEGVDL